MKANFFFIIILFTTIVSCIQKQETIYNHTNEIEELGQNYYYLGDANESQILLNLRPKANKRVGQTIIPAEVIKYNFNQDFIIAKTMQSVDGKKSFEYWIVDKRLKNDSLKASDSLTFFKEIEKVNLKLKIRK